MLTPWGFAQTFSLGPFKLSLQGTVEVGYDSNVDDAYPEDENPYLQKGDFYWMPGLSLRSEPVPMRPSTTVNLSLQTAYMDYFVRNDLDTEVYNANIQFETVHPRLTLSGGVGTELSVEANQDLYVPGGATYDPMQTDLANFLANWNYQKLRLVGSADYMRERHYFEKYQADDNDETTLLAGVYLDDFHKLSLYTTWQNTDTIYTETDIEENETVYNLHAEFRPHKWGGPFYDWERTLTTMYPGGNEREEIDTELGFTGDIPVELLRHPRITFALGIQYDETTSTSGENEKTFAPLYRITVADELQLTKTVQLSGNANWDNDVDEDEVGFVYNFELSQQIGARARHALTFTQEPEQTFGSTTDTKTTTYGYNFTVNDLVFYNLSMLFSAIYEEATPLGVLDALTEKTTTFNWGLTHTRQLSRKLNRIIAYLYTWENSNFHNFGANENHLLTYALTYDF